MAHQITELKSLLLHQIVGAPLLAIVQAQTQAAQATAEFIEQVGFNNEDTPAEKKGTSKTDNSFGKLRMITFSYQKPDIDGEPQTYTMEVPILSLVPIPAIQIKEAELDYKIKVTDVFTYESKTSVAPTSSSDDEWLSKNRTELRATMGQMESVIDVNGRSRLDYQMHIKMNVEQADVTAGLASIFRVLDQSISSGPSEESNETQQQAKADAKKSTGT